MTTSIPVSDKQWKKLLALKLNPSDTFSDVLDRLINFYESKLWEVKK